MLLGAIPNCSSCAGGKLRYNLLEGTYTCPGYMEGTQHLNLNLIYFNLDTTKIDCKAVF